MTRAGDSCQTFDAMTNVTDRLLRSLGFRRADDDAVDSRIDFSAEVDITREGQVSVPIDKIMSTRKFQRDLQMLEEIADAHRLHAERLK